MDDRSSASVALLLEVGQLPVVELVAPGLQGSSSCISASASRGEMTVLSCACSRVRCAVSALAVVLERGDRRRQLAVAAGDVAATRRSRRQRLGSGRRRLPLGQPGPAIGQLVGRRVEPLQFEEVVAQHDTTLLDSGVVGIGARGSSTLAGTVVPPSTRS